MIVQAREHFHPSLVVANFEPNNWWGHYVAPKCSSKNPFHLAVVGHEIRPHQNWWSRQHLQVATTDGPVDPDLQERYIRDVNGLLDYDCIAQLET